MEPHLKLWRLIELVSWFAAFMTVAAFMNAVILMGIEGH